MHSSLHSRSRRLRHPSVNPLATDRKGFDPSSFRAEAWVDVGGHRPGRMIESAVQTQQWERELVQETKVGGYHYRRHRRHYLRYCFSVRVAVGMPHRYGWACVPLLGGYLAGWLHRSCGVCVDAYVRSWIWQGG